MDAMGENNSADQLSNVVQFEKQMNSKPVCADKAIKSLFTSKRLNEESNSEGEFDGSNQKKYKMTSIPNSSSPNPTVTSTSNSQQNVNVKRFFILTNKALNDHIESKKNTDAREIRIHKKQLEFQLSTIVEYLPFASLEEIDIFFYKIENKNENKNTGRHILINLDKKPFFIFFNENKSLIDLCRKNIKADTNFDKITYDIKYTLEIIAMHLILKTDFFDKKYSHYDKINSYRIANHLFVDNLKSCTEILLLDFPWAGHPEIAQCVKDIGPSVQRTVHYYIKNNLNELKSNYLVNPNNTSTNRMNCSSSIEILPISDSGFISSIKDDVDVSVMNQACTIWKEMIASQNHYGGHSSLQNYTPKDISRDNLYSQLLEANPKKSEKIKKICDYFPYKIYSIAYPNFFQYIERNHPIPESLQKLSEDELCKISYFVLDKFRTDNYVYIEYRHDSNLLFYKKENSLFPTKFNENPLEQTNSNSTQTETCIQKMKINNCQMNIAKCYYNKEILSIEEIKKNFPVELKHTLSEKIFDSIFNRCPQNFKMIVTNDNQLSYLWYHHFDHTFN